MATQPDILQDEISRRSGQGWQLVSRTETEAQMRKPKRFSFVWAFLWLLVFGIGIVVYLLWHWAKSDQLIFLRVVDGQIVVTSTRSFWGTLFAPVGAYWRWAGQRKTTQGRVLAYGGPVAAVIVLIVIISVASATSGGGDGDGAEQAAAQQNEPAADAEISDGDSGADPEPTEEPTEPLIERIVPAAPGAVAEAEDVRITINEIRDPWISDNQFIEPESGRRFVAFDVTIQNTGDSGTHGANPFNFTLSDVDAFAYEAAFFGPEPSLNHTDLGSGQQTRGWVGFEVNQATPLDVLKYDPDIFTTDDIEFRFQQ